MLSEEPLTPGEDPLGSSSTIHSPHTSPQQHSEASEDPLSSSDRFASAVRYVDRDDPVPTKREGHLSVLLPLTSAVEPRTLIDFRVYVELSAFLAFKQFQHRSDQILKNLPELLEGCDFTWTYQHHDTRFSPLEAARALSKANGWYVAARENYENDNEQLSQTQDAAVVENSGNLHNHGTTDYSISQGMASTPTLLPQNLNETNANNAVSGGDEEPENDSQPSGRPETRQDITTQRPFAILGAARSTVSQTLGILGGAIGLPQISSSSTASTLDESPYFARTVPTNDGDAHAIVAYLHNHLKVTHLGVLFLNDAWGRRYEQDIQYFASRYGIHVESVAYEDPFDLEQTMKQLKDLRLRYFLGLVSSSSWKPVIREAYRYNLIGNPEHQWFFGDLVELVGGTFALDRETESDIANALHGVGVVFLRVSPHERFDRMLAAVADDKVLQDEFIASHAEPHLLQNFTFDPLVGRSLFQYLTFDAVIALGITACNTPGLFNGAEFYRNLLKVDFEGVSGKVRLHNKTGTRIGDNFQFQVVNLLLNDSEISPNIFFFHETTSIIELAPAGQAIPEIEELMPFTYQNNNTKPPLPLPPAREEKNLIPAGVLYFGLFLSGSIMIFSMACALWTYLYRNEYVVRASQPIFLYQLCLGCFILAAAIIPMSFQENMQGLDAACKSTPWLICVGFAVAISALFSKAHRMNRLMKSGTGFRRVTVQPKDVMKAFLVLITFNIALLTAWTASPYSFEWRRTYKENYDEYGRSVESFGVCRPGGPEYLGFFIPLGVANIVILVFTTIATYRGRNLPSEFSETSHLSLSMISLTETCILGGTTIIAVLDIPTAFYLVGAVILFIFCLSILIPVFLPKYWNRQAKEPRGRAGSVVVAQSNFRSSVSNLLPGNSSNDDSGLVSSSNGGLEVNSQHTRKSGNVSTFFASQPQPVLRYADSMGANASKHSSGHVRFSNNNQVRISGFHPPRNNIRATTKQLPKDNIAGGGHRNDGDTSTNRRVPALKKNRSSQCSENG